MIKRAASRHSWGMMDVAAGSDLDGGLVEGVDPGSDDREEVEDRRAHAARAARMVQFYFDFIWRSLRRLGVLPG